MNLFSQVVHVLAKDVREVLWLLVAYLGLVTVATVRTFGFMLSWPEGTGTLLMIGIVITALFAAGAVIQGDSPTRPNAFWTKLPLRPSAVFGAKIAFCLGLIAIGLVGQTAGVLAHGVRGLEAVQLIAEAISGFGYWLLFALLIAALLPDQRSFVLTVILIPLVITIAVNVIGLSIFADATDRPFGVYRLIGTTGMRIYGWLLRLGCVALIARLFLIRDVGRATRVGGFVLAVSMFLPLGWGGPPEIPRGALLPPESRFAFALDTIFPHEPRTPARDDEIQLVLLVPTIPQHLYVRLLHGVVVIELSDGSTVRAPLSGTPDFSRGAMPSEPGVRWLNDARSGVVRQYLSAELPENQQRALRHGIARVVLEGQVHVLEAVTSATLPLAVGSEATADRRYVRLEEVSDRSRGPAISIRESVVGGPAPGSTFSPGFGRTQCALVNRARGEAVALRYAHGGSTVDGLVLPGTPIRLVHMTCEWEDRSGAPPRPTQDWLRDAEFVTISHVHRGSYPLRLELPR